MIDILLIRHPETDLAGTFCGHSDPPINRAGEAQLSSLLQGLQDEPLDAVYSSDLQRAQTLAQALAASHQIPCITLPALREIYFGDWETRSWAQIERQNPPEAAAWLSNYPHQPAPGGEALATFETRVLTELDRIFASPYERIAIVTHAGVIRTILTARCNFKEEEARTLTKAYCSTVRYTPHPTTVPQ